MLLGKVLGLAEKYALGENIIYGYYNMTSAYGEELLSLFIKEIELLRISYKNIKFPSNLSNI